MARCTASALRDLALSSTAMNLGQGRTAFEMPVCEGLEGAWKTQPSSIAHYMQQTRNHACMHHDAPCTTGHACTQLPTQQSTHACACPWVNAGGMAPCHANAPTHAGFNSLANPRTHLRAALNWQLSSSTVTYRSGSAPSLL